jgi:PAS domain S-box-containing protein
MNSDKINQLISITELIPQPSLLIDSKAQIIYQNKEWERMLGAASEIDVVRVIKLPKNELINLVLKLSKLSINESIAYHFWQESNIGINYWLSGNIKMIETDIYLCVFSDLTKNKYQLTNLADSEKRYKNIIESAPDSIIVLNNKAKIIRCNSTFFRKTGLHAYNVYYKYINEIKIFSDYNLFNFIRIFQYIKKHKYYPPFEVEWKNIHGEKFVAEVHISMMKNSSRKDFEILAIARDITQRKQVEQSLQLSEEKHRMLFESMNNSMALFELLYDENNKLIDAKFLEVNSYFVSLVGIDRDYLIGKTYSELFKKLEYYWFNLFEKVNASKKSVVVEKYVNLFNKYFEVTIYAAQKNQIAVIYKDVNERILAQIEAEKAKRKAEESDKLKSAFLANMSHEIRTPMNAIIGFSQLLKKASTSEEQRNRFIDIIDNNCNLLLKLIDDILDLSKIEASAIKIEPYETNIELILYEFHAFFDVYKKEKQKDHLELIMQIDKNLNLKNIVTDKNRFKQVFSNLIGNAIKYTEEGHVEFGAKPYGQKYIEFYVKDSGIGIRKEQHNKVFNRFWQHETGSNKKYYGAGLGLSISQKLVALLGGKIWFESEFGSGSTFHFIIPKNYINQTTIDFVINDDFADINWVGKKVLIAEDDMASYFLLFELLEETGIEIHHAKNGREAIDFFNQNKFDIVLMDIQMPELNGFIAVKAIKQINPKTPVIAQTVLVNVDDKESCYKAGFDFVVSKPIDTALLVRMMKRFIQSR